MKKELDVRTLPPTRRHPAIFETFDALVHGDAFVLVNDHDPKSLLYQFQAERTGEYEWWPLGREAETWRIQISRRGASAPRPRTIHELLQSDHVRLDALFHRALETPGTEGLGLFLQFQLGLERHIKIEEEMLFPEFEKRTGMGGAGPTEVMRQEHREIKELMSQIKNRWAAGISTKDLAARLLDVLGGHNHKEEAVLYPMCDSIVGPDEKARLIAQMEAVWPT